MAFSLKRQSSKIAHLNVREEKHGEESVVAVDVKVQADVGNDFLDSLSPGLRAALYAPDGDQLAGLEAPLSLLRYPQLDSLHWNAPMGGLAFVIHGARKSEDLEFGGNIEKALVLDAKEGGTVALTFQVQIHPDARELGALSSFLGRSTKVSVRPAEQSSEPPKE